MRPIPNLSETEKAYLAGIVDGEGSINIIRRSARKRPRQGKPRPSRIPATPQHFIRLSITNTSPALINWLVEKINGHFCIDPRTDFKGRNHQLIFIWELFSKQAYEVLRLIRPYLVMKGHQADICFDFQCLINPKNRGPIKGKVLARREQLRIALQDTRHTFGI